MLTDDRGIARPPAPPRRWARLVTTAACAAALTGAGLAATSPIAAAPTARDAVADLVSVTAAIDTYVVAERPTLVYGNETKLTAATWADWHSESYLRFDVPAGPPDRPIASAKLTLRFQRLDAQPAVVELRALTGAWSESTTYATRPSVGAVLDSVSLPGQGTASVTLDLTGVVTGAGALDVAMTNPTPLSVSSVYSSEAGTAANRPTLVIEYAPAVTLCGASFAAESGETYQQALAREDGLFDGLDIVRVFYSGLPQAWPGKLDAGDRPMIISFKAHPNDVNAGTHDVRLRDWFATAPRDRDIYWTYFHEPENDIEGGAYTAAAFRSAFARVSALADEAANPRLKATLILMGWTVDPASGRTWTDYYPGAAAVDVIGWDLYNPSWRNGNYKPVTDLFARVIAASASAGKPFGIAETGSPLVAGDAGEARGAWLRALIGHLASEGALFIAYFDLDWTTQAGIDYRLRDAPSVAAWREFCG
jgi:hypothetical protein